MNYKIEGAIKKNKNAFIICLILWLILAIVFVAPVAYSSFQANASGVFSLNTFMEVLVDNITNPFATLGNIFSKGATHNFVSTLIGFSIVYVIIFLVGFFKSTPKNEYTDIEHGSSDWSQKGKQYKILDKNKGIILAENNYLPVDKRGNVNVLVVGRFRFR